MRRKIDISFIERERFNQRTEPMQNPANHSRFAAVNIEPRRQNDQIRTTLQRHERGHG